MLFRTMAHRQTTGARRGRELRGDQGGTRNMSVGGNEILSQSP